MDHAPAGHAPHDTEAKHPRWQPIPAIDRRVFGVLVEKAKTTPEAYPMSLNAIAVASSQKNNRSPLMQLEPEDVQESLDRLRKLGAVAEVQGGGRVPRFRHYAYDWLGVDKVELAVMTELLLRGAQTEGELRGRAARMEPIADVAALRPVLNSLKAKNLILSITPEGRGHVVSHALYEARELEKIKAEHEGFAAAEIRSESTTPIRTAEPSAGAHAATSSPDEVALLREEIRDLRRELDELRTEVRDLRHELGT